MLRALKRQLFPVRVGYHRWKRRRHWRTHPQRWATTRQKATAFPSVLFEHRSPLDRGLGSAEMVRGKIHNVRLALRCLNELVVQPGEVFSFCRLVGPTGRRQGYRPGPEMHDGEMQARPGGGLCQLANMMFLLAIHMDARIIERHRHSLDLAPDQDRTVPFGCGATIFYNYVDLQFENTLDVPVLIHVHATETELIGQVRTQAPLTFRITLQETNHRWVRDSGAIYRENMVWRVHWPQEQRQLLFQNRCRVAYEAQHLLE
ncbi:MAG: VanW family protein [Planctomycetota bacterium]